MSESKPDLLMVEKQLINQQVLKFVIDSLPRDQQEALNQKLLEYAETFNPKARQDTIHYIKSYLTK